MSTDAQILTTAREIARLADEVTKADQAAKAAWNVHQQAERTLQEAKTRKIEAERRLTQLAAQKPAEPPETKGFLSLTPAAPQQPMKVFEDKKPAPEPPKPDLMENFHEVQNGQSEAQEQDRPRRRNRKAEAIDAG